MAETVVRVSLVTDEMVTRAYSAFLRGVTAITPKGDSGGFVHPRTVMRKALEAALDNPDLDGVIAILHREPDGSLSAHIADAHPET